MAKFRPGSTLPKGRNFKGNRFAGLEEKGETSPDAETGPGESAPNPFAKGKKKAKGKGKKRPGMPPQAMGLAMAMAKAAKK